MLKTPIISTPMSNTLVVSPLTGTSHTREIRRIGVCELTRRWQDSFGIDITNELGKADEVVEFRCLDTDLLFFRPHGIDGSENLYRQLGTLPWYYMDEKWEHRIVFPMLNRTTRFLEIGCGKGAFLSRAAELGATGGIGIDLNSEAIAEGRSLGRSVKCANLLDYADQNTEAFDVVCAFQVLEHVPEPRPFLEAAIRLTRPGGRLVLSVPNAGSILGRDTSNLLDMPPHHISRWSCATFRSLPSLMPIRVEFIRNEPLASYHVEWYVSRLSSWGNGRIAARLSRAARASLRLILRRFPQLFSGHTHVACFRKIAE